MSEPHDWMAGMTDLQRAEVARLESRIVSFEKRWQSLEADWNDCRKLLAAAVKERDALRKRVAELEALSKPVYISHGQRVESIDLRERLVCAALTGLCADPNLDMDESGSRAAVAIADRTLAAMRKGDSDAQ